MSDPVLYDEGDTDFGNTQPTALSIALVSVVTGRTGGGDLGDMFRIDLPGAGRIDLRLDGLSGDIDLGLVNSAGQQIRTSARSSSAAEDISAPVAAGTWYIRVYPYSAQVSDYQLHVTAVLPVIGTPMDDTLIGTIGADTLYGLGGNDTFYGGEGDDLLVGSTGDDLILGSDGNDILDGGAGNDTLLGEAGNDTAYGGSGDDLIKTGASAPATWQSRGDQAWGGTGNDTIQAAEGYGTLGGGTGDDLIDARGQGLFVLWGGAGNDTIFAADVAGRMAGGGEGNDLIFGGTAGDILAGGQGRDTLHGNDGDDRLALGTGADHGYGGMGNDTIFAGPGADRLWGGEGADRFEFWRETGRNRIEDFDAAEGDVIALGQSLWRADYGLLRPHEVVAMFGRLSSNGHAVLDFGAAGTVVVLMGVTTLDGLEESLLLI